MNFRASAVTIAIGLFANSFISVAQADEHPSGLQTELTATTISGYDDTSVAAPPELSPSSVRSHRLVSGVIVRDNLPATTEVGVGEKKQGQE